MYVNSLFQIDGNSPNKSPTDSPVPEKPFGKLNFDRDMEMETKRVKRLPPEELSKSPEEMPKFRSHQNLQAANNNAEKKRYEKASRSLPEPEANPDDDEKTVNHKHKPVTSSPPSRQSSTTRTPSRKSSNQSTPRSRRLFHTEREGQSATSSSQPAYIPLQRTPTKILSDLPRLPFRTPAREPNRSATSSSRTSDESSTRSSQPPYVPLQRTPTKILSDLSRLPFRTPAREPNRSATSSSRTSDESSTRYSQPPYVPLQRTPTKIVSDLPRLPFRTPAREPNRSATSSSRTSDESSTRSSQPPYVPLQRTPTKIVSDLPRLPFQTPTREPNRSRSRPTGSALVFRTPPPRTRSRSRLSSSESTEQTSPSKSRFHSNR
ncbi:hypothetical protein HA402_009222 [Bradysia odoriphaga]|nr:hypothetical protein HA402_009222 [Bradysia odoriphaga]